METKYFVYPYRYECDNAIMLKNRLGGMRIKLQGSVYKHDPDRHIIVNWGNSKCPYSGLNVVNQPFNVSLAVNKSTSFDIFRNAGVPTLEITRHKPLADQWVKDGHSVIGRTQLKGNNGAGIFFLEENPDKEAKLYTKYIPDCIEYRVNVYREELISIRSKQKGPGKPENKIKSGLNGYFFTNADDEPKERLDFLFNTAKLAVKALGLDFGGVDILFNPKTFEIFVLEVNTAPELRGDAVTKLATCIKRDFHV